MNSIGLYRRRVCSSIFSDNEHFRLIARFYIVDWLYLLQATVLGIVEGLTEFLPISSTGHLIIASDLVGFAETPGADEFVVAIQSGAILAVCWYYRERIWAVLRGLTSSPKEQRLAVNTVVAFLPAAVIGVFAAGYIKHYLFNPTAVAVALIVGGFIILWVENRIVRLRKKVYKHADCRLTRFFCYGKMLL